MILATLAEQWSRKMRVDASHELKWGFSLDEPALRTLVQVAQDQIVRAQGEPQPIRLEAKLRDGSLVETNSIEEVLAIDNSGKRRVCRIDIVAITAGEAESRASMSLVDPTQTKSTTSMHVEVVSADRDWAFTTASEYQHQLRRIRRIGLEPIVQGRWSQQAPMLLLMLIMPFVISKIPNSRIDAIETLEPRVSSGEIADPIIFIMEYERLAASRDSWIAWVPVLLLLLAVGAVMLWHGIVPWLHPCYRFEWGDQIAKLRRRDSIAKFVWITLVGGIVISLAATFIWGQFFGKSSIA